MELGEIGVYIGAYLWVVFDKLCSYVDVYIGYTTPTRRFSGYTLRGAAE